MFVLGRCPHLPRSHGSTQFNIRLPARRSFRYQVAKPQKHGLTVSPKRHQHHAANSQGDADQAVFCDRFFQEKGCEDEHEDACCLIEG